jgi:S1-C subfamily serine protease
VGIEGVAIVRTIPGSSAARAGLRGIDASTGTLGDVIAGANGQTVRRMSDLTDQLEQAASLAATIPIPGVGT